MRRLLSVLLALTLTAAASLAQDMPAEPREGGIVGTGIAPLGIIGVVTALGSIHVNGQRIVFPEGFPVASPLGPTTAETLRPGDVVAVRAVPAGPDWQAVSISRLVALIGPVEATATDSAIVMGSRVEGPVPAGLAPGDWVAVSGLWRGAELMASAIEPIAPRDRAAIQGSWLPGIGAPGSIGGSRLQGISPQHLSPGQVVRAEGKPIPGGLEAETLSFGVFETEPGLVLAEGYLSRPDSAGMYALQGAGLLAYTDTPGMIDPDERVLRCAGDPTLSDTLGCGETLMQRAE